MITPRAVREMRNLNQDVLNIDRVNGADLRDLQNQIRRYQESLRDVGVQMDTEHREFFNASAQTEVEIVNNIAIRN